MDEGSQLLKALNVLMLKILVDPLLALYVTMIDALCSYVLVMTIIYNLSRTMLSGHHLLSC